MTDQITNNGGTLTFERIIRFTISRSCDVALRPVPKRSAGEVLDTGSYVFHPMRIELVTRLTYDEQLTLSAIHEADEAVTLTVGNCTYSDAWLEKPEIVYRHSFDGTDDRPYLATLNLYAVNESCSGSFDGNFTYVLERNISKIHRVAIDEFVSSDPTINTNIWSEKLKRLELVVRLTDTEKCGLNSSYWKQTVSINDTICTYNGWMTDVEFEWNPINYERPWLSTINFIVLSEDCPSGGGGGGGEQIINGGFETGDLTGWTKVGDGSVTSDMPHSGTYSFHGANGTTIEQTLSTPVEIDSVDYFTLFQKKDGGVDTWFSVYVTFYFTDDTQGNWFPSGRVSPNWEQFTLSGIDMRDTYGDKTIRSIKIQLLAQGGYYSWIDDISLMTI